MRRSTACWRPSITHWCATSTAPCWCRVGWRSRSPSTAASSRRCERMILRRPSTPRGGMLRGFVTCWSRVRSCSASSSRGRGTPPHHRRRPQHAVLQPHTIGGIVAAADDDPVVVDFKARSERTGYFPHVLDRRQCLDRLHERRRPVALDNTRNVRQLRNLPVAYTTRRKHRRQALGILTE